MNDDFIFSYEQSIEMTKTGRVNVKPIISHRFTLENSIEAFETHKNKIGDPIKILIHCNPSWKPS